MGRLTVATIQGNIPMDLRDNELKDSLLSGSLLGLSVEEAILHYKLFLRFEIGRNSLSVGHLQQGLFKSLSRSLPMLDYLIEDRILFLFQFPVSNVSGGQPCWLGTNGSLLANSLVTRIRS